MSDGLTRQEFREGISDVKEMIAGVHERLDVLNGRTRKLENAQAVNDERWMRLDKATQVTPPHPQSVPSDGVKADWKTATLVWSVVGGAVSGLAMGLFKIAQLIASVAK